MPRSRSDGSRHIARRRRVGDFQLFTIGYEGRSVDELLARLKSAAIATLIDVRYRPQSRKRGFSKSTLSARCQIDGIGYVHRRDLGTPPEMMKRFGVGGYDSRAFDAYRRHLRGQTTALQETGTLVEASRCCLLCYEADASACHRRVVADELSRIVGASVKHL